MWWVDVAAARRGGARGVCARARARASERSARTARRRRARAPRATAVGNCVVLHENTQFQSLIPMLKWTFNGPEGTYRSVSVHTGDLRHALAAQEPYARCHAHKIRA